MATELTKLGAEVIECEDSLTVKPPKNMNAATIDTYDDHRMAMAFSMVGDVVIRNPGCVEKTFPGYFDELRALDMGVTTSGDRRG